MAPPAGAGAEGRPARRRGTGTGTSPGRNKVWVEPPGKSHSHHHHHPTPARSPPPAAAKRVAVVYYLCRNRHLEHPHFIEVPLAAPEEGLYLRGQSVSHSSAFHPSIHPYMPRMPVIKAPRRLPPSAGSKFRHNSRLCCVYQRADVIRVNGVAAADVINRLNVLRGKGMASMYSWSCKRYCTSLCGSIRGRRIAENSIFCFLLPALPAWFDPFCCISPGATRTASCGTTCPMTIWCSPRRATSTSSRAPSSLTARRRQVSRRLID